MTQRLLLAVLAIAALIASPSAQTPARPQRIISLVPALTEMLFAVGAGPQVVGVSSFDEYPAQVKNLERVGALLDPNLERILALKPDLVAIYGSQQDLQTQLTRAKIPVYSYRHAGLADIITTLQDIGGRSGHAAEAQQVAAGIEARLASVRKLVGESRRPRTMLVFGREAGALRGIYASGGIGFLHDMLVAAGGENVFADIKRESVQATTELILTRQPDIILEIRGSSHESASRSRDLTAWQALPSVPAVRNDGLRLIVDSRMLVPGPRVAEAVELLARELHPDRFR